MINSKKLLAFSFLLSIITFMSVSRASDQLLATFSADLNGDTYQLAVSSTDQDQILTSITVSKIFSDGTIKNSGVSIKYFIRDGLELYQPSIQNLTKIYSHNLSEQDGGIIVLESFLKPSANKEKHYELELVKDQTKWCLLYKGQPITHIHSTLGLTGILDLVIK